MKHLKNLTPQAWVAIILAVIAAMTFVAGICIPPPGEVHPSILKGIGLMIALVAIFFTWDAVIRGMNTKFEHGKTKVTINQPKSENNEKD